MFDQKRLKEFWDAFESSRLWEVCWDHTGSAICACEHCAAIRAYPKVRCECLYCQRIRDQRQAQAHKSTEA